MTFSTGQDNTITGYRWHVALTEEFGRGFSRSNLQNMRKFYLTYADRLPGKDQAISGKLVPLEYLTAQAFDSPEAPFRLSWSLAELKQQYNSGLFDRFVKQKVYPPPCGWCCVKKARQPGGDHPAREEQYIHTREYQLYLPDLEPLQCKLEQWSGEAQRQAPPLERRGIINWPSYPKYKPCLI